MWNCMLLLFPELWDKFGWKLPEYEVLEKEGFPIDETSDLFMRWLYDCTARLYNTHEYSYLSTEMKRLEREFIDSIKDEKMNHFCDVLIHGAKTNIKDESCGM